MSKTNRPGWPGFRIILDRCPACSASRWRSGLWVAGSKADHGAAVAAGGFGFSLLCFGNAATVVLRSVRRRPATREEPHS